MDLRRVLLLLAILLLVGAVVASFAPPPEEESDTAPAPTTTEPEEPSESGRNAAGEPVEVELEVDGATGDGKARPEEVSAERGARVIATVEVPAPGQVALQGLGQNAPAEPGTPALFDLLVDRPGRYEAIFTPVEGPRRTAGALVVGEGEADGREAPDRRGEASRRR